MVDVYIALTFLSPCIILNKHTKPQTEGRRTEKPERDRE